MRVEVDGYLRVFRELQDHQEKGRREGARGTRRKEGGGGGAGQEEEDGGKKGSKWEVKRKRLGRRKETK